MERQAVYQTLPKPAQTGTIPPYGSITPTDAQAILHADEGELLLPERPVLTAYPVDSTPANVLTLGETANNAAVTTTATVPVTNQTAAGLMVWAKANPIPALAIGAGVVLLIMELTKKRR